jgi:hypothetical protein
MRFGINDADDSAIGRRILSLEWEARFFTSAPENQFPLSRAYRIERDHRLALRLKTGIERLNDEQLPPLKRIVLDGCDDRSDDARQLHFFKLSAISSQLSAKTVSKFSQQIEDSR